MSVGLIDDLLEITSRYTTEYLTFQLLGVGRDYARRGYRSGFWRTKVLVEMKGLIVDDAVIGDRWDNYYRSVNRTFYGMLYTTRFHGLRVESVPLNVPVVSILCIDQRDVLAQLPDRSIYYFASETSEINTVPFTRRIRQMVYDEETMNNLLLDERGEVWSFWIDDATFRRRTDHTSLGEVVGIADTGTVLLRDGSVVNYYCGRDGFRSSRIPLVESITGDPIQRIVEIKRAAYLDSQGRLYERGWLLGHCMSGRYTLEHLCSEGCDCDPDSLVIRGEITKIPGFHWMTIEHDNKLRLYRISNEAKTVVTVHGPPVQFMSSRSSIAFIGDY